jgi:hypothetical protein
MWERGSAMRASPRDRSTLVLGVSLLLSLGANALLLVGMLVLLVGRAGVFAPPAAAPAPATGARGAALGPTPSATPGAGWLSVAPTSVQLGCAAGQQTQFAVLANRGPASVSWQAELAGAADQAGVTLAPTRGELRTGTSVVLQLRNVTRSSGAQGVAGRQGSVRFAPTTPAAGSPARLSYTTVGCR